MQNNQDLSVPLIIEEKFGKDRVLEPVTCGIPFPKGSLTAESGLRLLDNARNCIPLQTRPLARWSDGSIKWLLLDFQVSVPSHASVELTLTRQHDGNAPSQTGIVLIRAADRMEVDTGRCRFHINTAVFKPFERVIVNGKDVVDGLNSRFALTDEAGAVLSPVIDRIECETEGKQRTTIRIEGTFKSRGPLFASFFARLNFYADSSAVRVDFTILNPRAAVHPGGLWDLGDQGSIYFRDLSVALALKAQPDMSFTVWQAEPHDTMRKSSNPLAIYQDSSGGENWKSPNHVNRHGEVKTAFRGYKVFEDGTVVHEGLRACPAAAVQSPGLRISAALQYFWQDFPKAIETTQNILTMRFFPRQFQDLFELQGGEQKTHSLLLSFSSGEDQVAVDRIFDPLVARSTPEWYAGSGAIPYLVPDSLNDPRCLQLINSAVEGNNSFEARREIIDEYGWRNFGELYADHESVGQNGNEPRISHYNNQYDCIFGMLRQFLSSRDLRWFRLADQLCRHVKDIDIYHTDKDRPEYNRGLFWHTEHYITACTASHRCFSIRHIPPKIAGSYGGGPSLSHNYCTGLLIHYYLTGNEDSLHAVQELSSFVINNIQAEYSVTLVTIRHLRQVKSFLKCMRHGRHNGPLTFGLDGPGRASGNALNTLMDAFQSSRIPKYLNYAELLIRRCIHPDDDPQARDLLDAERKWMYLIFLQALGRYIDAKTEIGQFDSMWLYVKNALLNYGAWMSKNEYPYLTRPEKLEYPNETWAAQDFRKSNVLLCAARYADLPLRKSCTNKAASLRDAALKHLLRFETNKLTRPIAVLLQNAMVYSYLAKELSEIAPTNPSAQGVHCSAERDRALTQQSVSSINTLFPEFSIHREILLIRPRLKLLLHTVCGKRPRD